MPSPPPPFVARHARVANEIVRAFTCGHCGQLVFFENRVCLRCSTALGFVPRRLTGRVDRHRVAAGDLRRCANAAVAACNWMLEAGEPGRLCRSCRLTRTRPSDADRPGWRPSPRPRRRSGGVVGAFQPAARSRARPPAFDLLSSAQARSPRATRTA